MVDLLGAVAYGELSAFERLVDDAKLAPTVRDKVEMGAWRAWSSGTSAGSTTASASSATDPFEAMAPFEAPIDLFHATPRPPTGTRDWSRPTSATGLAADFYREIAAYLDADTRDLIIASLDDSGQADFAVRHIRQAIADDPKLGGRLALWGRRLMGEALTQAQRVAAERDALTALLAGGIDRPGLDLAAIGRMFTRITERHNERMAELGLSA